MSDLSNIGAQYFYAEAQPATHDAAGFAALTWVRVNGYAGGHQFGQEGTFGEVTDISTGDNLGYKSTKSGVESDVAFYNVPGDAGQAALRAFSETCQGAGSVKIGYGACDGETLATGDVVKYATVIFVEGPENEVGDENQGFIVKSRQNGKTITATEPA